jgi:hypothetical protein
MPLAFESLSHGRLAFGFFNIDSDMLLLDRYFFFAKDFCEHVGRTAEEAGNGPYRQNWTVYPIERPEDAGDLTAAIYGIYYQGFIGDLYRLYPFPQKPEDFKQSPQGHGTQALVRRLIEKYTQGKDIPFTVSEGGAEVGVGDYRFGKEQFHALLNYVWQGGYPRWRDDIRPEYVLEMRRKIEQSAHPIFENVQLDRP